MYCFLQELSTGWAGRGEAGWGDRDGWDGRGGVGTDGTGADGSGRERAWPGRTDGRAGSGRVGRARARGHHRGRSTRGWRIAPTTRRDARAAITGAVHEGDGESRLRPRRDARAAGFARLRLVMVPLAPAAPTARAAPNARTTATRRARVAGPGCRTGRTRSMRVGVKPRSVLARAAGTAASCGSRGGFGGRKFDRIHDRKRRGAEHPWVT